MNLWPTHAELSKMTADEIFDIRYEIDESGCWLWTGQRKNSKGGCFSVNGVRMDSSRFSYQRFKGEIPDGKCVQRTCGIPHCVNPDHLQLSDSACKGKTFKRDIPEFCNQGHVYVPHYFTKSKKRRYECKECRREKRRKGKAVARLKKFAKLSPLKGKDIVADSFSIPLVGTHVYFLIEEDKIVYVGMSANNYIYRVGEHIRKEWVFDSICVLPVDIDNVYQVEAAYIHKFKPKYNERQYKGKLDTPA